MRFKKGDSLIEVSLAVGIFSMVAITVVSVVAASTSGAQSSLETTITREEMDAQAEALRFIHDAYVSGTQSKKITDNMYTNLWKAVKNLAVDEASADLNYAPQFCNSIYGGRDSGTVNPPTPGAKPFIVNTRKLDNPSDINGILVTSSQRNIFFEPITYPRIIYGQTTSSSWEENEDLYSQVVGAEARKEIIRVEGLYIIAVKGQNEIVSGADAHVDTKDAYYDFYIRSCWMPVGADHASTISTVIRLYDPAVICYARDRDCAAI